jgi:hypothetical protein
MSIDGSSMDSVEGESGSVEVSVALNKVTLVPRQHSLFAKALRLSGADAGGGLHHRRATPLETGAASGQDAHPMRAPKPVLAVFFVTFAALGRSCSDLMIGDLAPRQ